MSKLQLKFQELQFEKKNYICDIKLNTKKTFRNIYLNSLKKFSFFNPVRQKKILILINNSSNYIEILISTILSGNIFCPIPYFTSIQEIEKTYKYLKPHLIITDKQLQTKIIPSSKIINVNLIKPNNERIKLKKINENAIACIYYSSGTTSDPKGVMYSHNNIFYLISSINQDFKFTTKSKHLVCLPFGHTASINYSIFPSLFNKSTFYIAEDFLSISDKFFYYSSLYKINYIQIVPTIAIMLIKINEKINKLNLKNLKFIGCGSSTLPKEIQDQFHKKFKIKLSNLYGLSETGPSHFDNPLLKSWESGYIGKPLSVNKCKISKNGEILLKGKNIFIGYYNNNKLYKKSFIKGWFKTGDLGKKINDNLFQFIDRKKDLIIKGAINIVPAEIEEHIYKFKQVKEVAVVGINDEIHGEEIYACITTKKIKNKDLLLEKISVYLKNKLSSFKMPRKIFIISNMPLTKSGKIKRREAKNIIYNLLKI